MLTDTHAHLYWESFKEDFDEVIQRAQDAGVSTIINVGVDVSKSREALKQVQEIKWPSGMTIYSTIGIHPHESSNFSSDEINELEKVYRSDHKKVIAVGECGLDFSSTSEESKPTSEVFIQKQLFQAQIDLAKKLRLPLIVHCRQAWDEVIDMTKDYFGIYHCYSGLPQTTNLILQTTNFLISFAGNITYPKNEYLQEAAKLIPIDRIVLETDCPFLPPQNHRGQRNEPANVLEIAQIIAEEKNLTIEQIADQTSSNAAKLFALSS